MRQFPFLLLLSLVFLVACDSEDQQLPEESQERELINGEFIIKYGQTINFPNNPMELKFSEVLEESRCPTEVVCVFEGRALIELQFAYSDIVEIAELTLWEGHPELAIGEAAGYQLELKAVNPVPTTSIPEVFLDYEILLKIEPK